MKPETWLLPAIAILGMACSRSTLAGDTALSPEVRTALESLVAENINDFVARKTGDAQLKFIEPDADGKSGWGLDYSWKVAKSNAGDSELKDGDQFKLSRLSYELAIDGSYVFDYAKNNKDLSTVTASVKMARGDFGKISLVDKSVTDEYQNCLLSIPFPKSEADIPLFNRATALCQRIGDLDKKVQKGPAAYYYWLDFHGGVEANQNYKETHTLFGLAAAISYRPAESRSMLNVPDLPFRLLRRLFDTSTSGYVAPIPTLLLGLDRLDADKDDPRSALTTDNTYTRAKGEVAFGTQVANIGGNIIRVTASYRYYRELSAPSAVKAAGLDEFKFFTASLRFPARMLPLIESDACELFVSYTDGKLPFTVAKDQTYELGIATNIKALADFLAR